MVIRTTIELDEELLARAKRALGQPTMRATVEEALRRASEQAETEFQERRARQLEFLRNLDKYLDLEVLKSDDMWR
jgi:Arc/MetJ family transcription regulator